MEQNDEFIRVGTTYYKIVDQPLVNGDTVKRRIPWNIEALRQDYGKNYIADIPKFDGFCTVPNHLDYHREIGTFYNLYERITHKLEAGTFPRIKSLMEHIFGEQYELGMDYLQILYEKPTQKLPVLLLVSTERNTGKTSFLNFLKLIFQDNVTFNTNEDFRSQFNADWAGKLLILVDEVLLSRKEDSERLKNLSTALTYKMEAKGKDRNEVQFFAKFVLCSNNESFPVIIDPEEIRYWVRKVEPLENDDPDFLRHLEAEIPHFLFHLKHERQLSTKKESRMWFNPSLIHTDALDNIIRHNRPRAELDMVELCLDVMERNNLTQYCFCPNDIHALLLNTHVKIEKWQILKVLKERWHLLPAANAYRYTTYNIDYTNVTNYMAVQRTGRYYTVQRDFLEPLRCRYVDSMKKGNKRYYINMLQIKVSLNKYTTTINRRIEVGIHFLLIGKKTFYTMTYLIISTNSSSADEKKNAQLHDLSAHAPSFRNTRLLFRGWGSKYRFCVPLNRGSESRKCQMSHLNTSNI